MALPQWLSEMKVGDFVRIGAIVFPVVLVSIPFVNKAIGQVVEDTVGERIGAVESGLADSLANQEDLARQLRILQSGQSYNDGMQAEQLEAILRLLTCQNDPSNAVCSQ